jgi:hypothetical protein
MRSLSKYSFGTHCPSHSIYQRSQSSLAIAVQYMNFPQIMDKSVRIWTHAEQHFIKNDNNNDNGADEEGYDELQGSLVIAIAEHSFINTVLIV